jgi:hypothetical protein
MAVVEWRGRLKNPDAGLVKKGLPTGEDVSKIIAAVGALRGAALAMVVGAILMLGTAWVAQSAAGTAGPAATPEAIQAPSPQPTWRSRHHGEESRPSSPGRSPKH